MKANLKKIIIALVSVIAFILVIYFMNKYNIFKDYSPTQIKEYINSFGLLSPVIYLLVLTILPLVLFPDSVIVIAGGMMFGVVNGSILTIIGSFLGATVSFYISRVFGKRVIEKFIKKDMVNLSEHSKKKGFIIILLLRLIPVFPFKIVSYSAGLSNIKFKDFTIATVLGSMPGIIVYTNLGDKTNEVGSSSFYISILLLVLLFAVTLVLKKKLNIEKKGEMYEKN